MHGVLSRYRGHLIAIRLDEDRLHAATVVHADTDYFTVDVGDSYLHFPYNRVAGAVEYPEPFPTKTRSGKMRLQLIVELHVEQGGSGMMLGGGIVF